MVVRWKACEDRSGAQSSVLNPQLSFNLLKPFVRCQVESICFESLNVVYYCPFVIVIAVVVVDGGGCPRLSLKVNVQTELQ